MPTRTAPEIELPPDAATADDHRNPRRRRRDEEEPPPDVGHLVQPEPRHDLDKMILHPDVKTDILAGLRALEKYAVRAGGGTNKRMGLYDVAMIKDNHKLAAGSLTAAYEAIATAYPDVPIQVEVTTTGEALEAVAAGARFIMCDNMSTDLLRRTIEALEGTGEEVEVEATGGLTLEVARAYAETGVDYLSVGGLTHSSPILDIALDLA